MKILQLKKVISDEALRAKMKSSASAADFRRWQVLLLVNSYDVDADYISDITGYSKANIYAIVQQFNKGEKAEISAKPRGGRMRSFMSIEEEKELLCGLEQKALKGQIVSYLDIKKIVEQQIGKAVSDDFIWDLFKRNGWTKHSPRPHHPKRNVEEQNDFKKNSRNVWLPPAMILPQP